MKTWSGFLSSVVAAAAKPSVHQTDNTNCSYTLLAQNDPVGLSTSNSDNLDFMAPHIRKETINLEDTQSYEELVGSKKRTNYTRILVIILIILVLAVVIAAVVYLVTRGGKDEDDNHRPPPPTHLGFELNDFLGGQLSPGRNNATWISDKELMYRDEYENIVKYNVETEEDSELAGSNIELIRETGEYELSPDKQYLLVATKYERIFRHSAAAIYDVIDIKTKKVTPIMVNGKHEHLLLAKWAPVGNGLAFVYNFNLFYIPSIGSPEVQITTNGNGIIRYGVTDWVYEEEVFSAKEAVWFSPNGKRLAYVMFDDTNVELMNIPVYGVPGSLDYQYPKTFSLNYPKPGTPNPDVALYTVDLDNVKAGVKLNSTEIPDPVKNRTASEKIIAAVGWQTNDRVISVWMNRIQNEAEIETCSVTSPTPDCHIIKHIASKTGWVDLFKTPMVNKDGSEILLIASQHQAEGGGFRHLITVPTDESGRVVSLTSGQFVVINILYWDQEEDMIFYLANTEDDPNEQFVYALKNGGSHEPQCLTCDISVNGVKQTFFSASFSPNGKYFMLTTDGPSIPRIDIYSWSVESGSVNIKWVQEWETNSELHSFLRHKTGPTITHIRLELDSGYDATVRLQIPPNPILDGRVKYPLLIDVYGGPDSYAGTNRFNFDYGSYLSSNASIIMAQINGRGSGLRGDRIMHEIYRRLGTVEIEDQIDAAKKLSKFPYIDEKRIGIWGWSYGGYAAGMALAKDDENIFACAASVAPVTDWIYYDTIYTERYMNTPQNNVEGYSEGRLSTRYDDFRGKNYFLLHGTFDDNVHFQQSMALSRSLELHDILFTQMSYVDENHSMFSVRKHLYHSLGQFFGRCFDIKQVF